MLSSKVVGRRPGDAVQVTHSSAGVVIDVQALLGRADGTTTFAHAYTTLDAVGARQLLFHLGRCVAAASAAERAARS
jgi:hypothetical protein